MTRVNKSRPMTSDEMNQYVQQSRPMTAQEMAYYTQPQSSSQDSGPSILHPAQWAAQKLYNALNFQNDKSDIIAGAKDVASGAGSAGQKLLQTISKYSPSPSQGSIGQALSPSVKSAENYDIDAAINAPRSGVGNALIKAAAGALPLFLIPGIGEEAGPEAFASRFAAAGGYNAAIHPNQDILPNVVEGGLSQVIPDALIRAAGKGADLLFQKGNGAVKQTEEDLKQANLNKEDDLQAYDSQPEPSVPAYGQDAADYVSENMGRDLNDEAYETMGLIPGDANQSVLTDFTEFARNHDEDLYSDTHDYDDNEIPQDKVTSIATPEAYADVGNWDFTKGMSNDAFVAMLPKNIGDKLKEKFQQVSQDSSLTPRVGGMELPYDPESLQGQQIMKALGRTNPNSSSWIEGATPQGMIDTLSPSERAQALSALQNSGGAKLNLMRTATASMPTQEMKNIAKTVGRGQNALIGSARQDLESNGTVGNLRNFIKQLNKSVSANAVGSNDQLITNFAQSLNHNILMPSIEDFDKATGRFDPEKGGEVTNKLKLANWWHSNIVKPLEATPDMRKAVSGNLQDDSWSRLHGIVSSALEKTNMLSKDVDQFGNKTKLRSSQIPKGSPLRDFEQKVSQLKQYEANPTLRAVSKDNFVGTPKEMLSGFENAVNSGALKKYHSVYSKYYEPLKAAIEKEDAAKASAIEARKAGRRELISSHKQVKRSLQDQLAIDKKNAKRLRNNPSYRESMLMNNARKLQVASPFSKLGRTMIRLAQSPGYNPQQ